jgi:hypothetical protein
MTKVTFVWVIVPNIYSCGGHPLTVFYFISIPPQLTQFNKFGLADSNGLLRSTKDTRNKRGILN